jgi:transcription termination/antitermination protein NusG
MEKKWYVLHALSGQENKVRDNITKRVQIEEMQDYVGDVLIPTEKVSEVKQGKRTTLTRKFFPGYVLIEMALYEEERDADGKLKLMEKPWTFIQATPGIIGFIGGERPVALRPDEVEQILQQVEEKRDRVKPKVEFEPGEMVKITHGPFLSFSGIVEEVDPERGKLKVSVSIFDRTVPVELEYWQVERGE